LNGPGKGGKRDRLVSNVRNWAVASTIAAINLLSRIVAFLMVITAEMLIFVSAPASARD
jgi:hypothetical protein